MAEYIDLRFYPWGNAYFATQQCGGAPYASTKRQCWYDYCHVKSPPEDCYTGAVVSQHLEPERTVDRRVGCGIHLQASWHKHWPYVECMYNATRTLDKANQKEVGTVSLLRMAELTISAETCATAHGFDSNAIETCASGKEGDTVQDRFAKATPKHPGTPTLVINGRQVVMDYDHPPVPNLYSEICQAAAHKPASCVSRAMIDLNGKHWRKASKRRATKMDRKRKHHQVKAEQV